MLNTPVFGRVNRPARQTVIAAMSGGTATGNGIAIETVDATIGTAATAPGTEIAHPANQNANPGSREVQLHLSRDNEITTPSRCSPLECSPLKLLTQCA